MAAERVRKEVPPSVRPVSGTRPRVRPMRHDLRCTQSARPASRWRLPTRITVHENGTAVAHYADEGFLRFSDLNALLTHHALRPDQVEPAE